MHTKTVFKEPEKTEKSVPTRQRRMRVSSSVLKHYTTVLVHFSLKRKETNPNQTLWMCFLCVWLFSPLFFFFGLPTDGGHGCYYLDAVGWHLSALADCQSVFELENRGRIGIENTRDKTLHVFPINTIWRLLFSPATSELASTLSSLLPSFFFGPWMSCPKTYAAPLGYWN